MWQAANIANRFKLTAEPVRDRMQPACDTLARVLVQEIVCWFALLPLGGALVLMLKYFRGYRIDNLKAIRREFRHLWNEHRAPLIICANHLTFIDSALIIWGLASNFWYWRNYRAFTWNLPAGDVFKKKRAVSLTLYLTKCIFLDRDGSAKHKHDVLNLCRFLLLKDQVVLIFPEGQRSRSGRFDEKRLRFGVGKIASSLKDCRVLCIYLRGDQQETFSNYPARGSRFTMKLRLLKPTSNQVSRKQMSVEIVAQIGAAIKNLENEYFAKRNGATTK
jgi:1-acyl-sn-glycerol-3-phosphate acyltransferase